MSTKKLTEKEEKACQQFLITGCKSEAYKNAYNCQKMKPATINVKASQLFAKDKITVRVKELQAERLKETKVDANYVLKRLIEIDEMDVVDILDDSGHIKPITQWPKSWRRTISGLDIQELMMGEVETVLRKIKWPDKVKNLELLGKHIDVQAFKEKREVEGELTVNNLIAEISESNGETRAVLPKHAK